MTCVFTRAGAAVKFDLRMFQVANLISRARIQSLQSLPLPTLVAPIILSTVALALPRREVPLGVLTAQPVI